MITSRTPRQILQLCREEEVGFHKGVSPYYLDQLCMDSKIPDSDLDDFPGTLRLAQSYATEPDS